MTSKLVEEERIKKTINDVIGGIAKQETIDKDCVESEMQKLQQKLDKMEMTKNGPFKSVILEKEEKEMRPKGSKIENRIIPDFTIRLCGYDIPVFLIKKEFMPNPECAGLGGSGIIRVNKDQHPTQIFGTIVHEYLETVRKFYDVNHDKFDHELLCLIENVMVSFIRDNKDLINNFWHEHEYTMPYSMKMEDLYKYDGKLPQAYKDLMREDNDADQTLKDEEEESDD